ncbi:MAG: response regulator, partial [Deltaproteobacteria bacterium]|nr:response regulator [Deltaproteobacteria bacterium]
MNILFIYNNLNEIKNIEQQINSAGHKIYTARNYKEASDVLLRIKTDIIFCELLSEKIDGIQILRRIKGSDNFVNIPFVFVSSTLRDEEDLSFFRKLGAESIIEKPITFKNIQNIIEKRLTTPELGFESRQKIISDEEFIEEYSNILTKRIQKRVKELESDQLFIHNLIN